MALPGQKKGKENDANGKPWLRVLKYLPFIRNCFVETSWKKQLPSRKAWYCLPSPAVSFTSYYYYGYVACTAIAASRVSNPFSLCRKDGSDVTLSQCTRVNWNLFMLCFMIRIPRRALCERVLTVLERFLSD